MTRQPYKLLHPIDSKSLQAIGRVAVYWGILEMTVDNVIAGTLDVSTDAVDAMIVGIGFQFRLTMLDGLSETIFDHKRRAELKAIIADIRAVSPERNFIMHAAWLGEGEEMQGHVLRRNKERARVENWNSAKIESIATEINDVTARLVGWNSTRRASARPSEKGGPSV
jgi:hypothetical protein